MTVGLLELRLRIPENHSLKGKRQVAVLAGKDREAELTDVRMDFL